MDFDIKKIAKLAKIKINDQEAEMLEKNIHDIIKLLDRLNKVDLEFDEGEDLERVLLKYLPEMGCRDDIVEYSMKSEDIINLAPESIAGCIVVPKIVE